MTTIGIITSTIRLTTCVNLPATSDTISYEIKDKKWLSSLSGDLLTIDNPFSIRRHITIGTDASKKQQLASRLKVAFLNSQIPSTTDGYVASPSFFPVSTMNHCIGSTRNPYLMKFSSSSRNPPIVSRRNPQFTRPEKSLKLELHVKRESRGLWILK